MSLHLHPVEAAASPRAVAPLDTVFFVIQRDNGHWSPAAKIITVHYTELDAEEAAARLKVRYPHQSFGVAMLRSEARNVASPVEIVHTKGNA